MESEKINSVFPFHKEAFCFILICADMVIPQNSARTIYMAFKEDLTLDNHTRDSDDSNEQLRITSGICRIHG